MRRDISEEMCRKINKIDTDEKVERVVQSLAECLGSSCVIISLQSQNIMIWDLILRTRRDQFYPSSH